ncbi:divergent protein kinase domain 1A isoform X2 [Octopus sinensis]|uniref:Divergent protein kinase domain 1A isoform X2 n=1 Tax=Octopus sinensis TaxID=2607531 RepID=A0A7E6FLA6_9MOLL|nr:divergent protein kinase domain 1A isoform X2 [Octopus sinensis]
MTLFSAVSILCISKKTMLVYSAFTGILLFSMLCVIVALYDPCNGRSIRDSLCELYEDGMVSGRLCYSLCKERVPVLSNCLKQQPNLKEFLWGRNLLVKVNMAPDNTNVLDTVLLEPWEGIKQDQFTRMIDKYLKEQLGPGDYTTTLHKILNFGDFNSNGLLTYGEARSLWSLLQHREFLLLLLFQDNDTFPRINGTCGSIYAVEHVANNKLFNMKSNSWLSIFLSDAYHWQFPVWKKRAKMSIGMIEFMMDIFEKNGVNYYMCNILPTSFGYTPRYDIKIIDILSVVSKHHLKTEMSNRSCYTDDDCTFSHNCKTQCNQELRKCSSDLVVPNLKILCDLLMDYLMYGAPNHITVDLERLLHQCQSLDNRQFSAEMDHAVLLNDLQLFIWSQIKYG